MARLDDYEIHPEGMDEYLANYGYHFSKKLCEWAISKMTDRNGNKVNMRSKQDIDTMLHNFGMEIKNDKGYDVVFVYHMAMSDFLGSSISNELGCMKYAKDVLDDVDGYPGIALSRFIADCNGKDEPISWINMI